MCLGQPAGLRQLFSPGFTAWGSFAELVALPHADHNLVRLPDDLAFVAAASLGCGSRPPFARWCNRTRRAGGMGRGARLWRGGLGAVLIACALGCAVVAGGCASQGIGVRAVVGRGAYPERYSATTSRTDPRVDGRGAHFSIEPSAAARPVRNSILCLRKRGRHAQDGLMWRRIAMRLWPMAAVIARNWKSAAAMAWPRASLSYAARHDPRGETDPSGLWEDGHARRSARRTDRSSRSFGGTGVTSSIALTPLKCAVQLDDRGDRVGACGGTLISRAESIVRRPAAPVVLDKSPRSPCLSPSSPAPSTSILGQSNTWQISRPGLAVMRPHVTDQRISRGVVDGIAILLHPGA